jgi:hypothetical protein
MSEAFTNHPNFRDYTRETTEEVLNSAPKWTYLYRNSSVKGKLVLSIRAKEVAHVLINVNRTPDKRSIFYSVHKSGAEQVKLSESTLFNSLDDMIQEIEAGLGKQFKSISEYEQELAEAEAEAQRDDGKAPDDEDNEELIASAGKVILKAMMDGHGSVSTALEAEYKGMINGAFLGGQASEAFLMQLSRWREFNHFTQEQHQRVLEQLGKSEEDWDNLKHFHVESSGTDNQTCVVCLTDPKNALFPGCGHICTCFSCGESLRECPLCRKPFGKVKPIKVFL